MATALTHPLAGQTVTAAELVGQRWIVGNAESDTTLLGGRAEHPTSPTWRGTGSRNSAWSRPGLGVTVVPGLVVPALPPSIAVARIDHLGAVRTTAVVSRAHPAADKFTELLRDAAELTVKVRRRL